jgi:iron complex outermembrane receptor protein
MNRTRRFQPATLAVAVTAVLAANVPQAVAQDTGQSAGGLEEIIVTAQRREEGLQDVPISVQAFDTQAIQNLGAQDISDLGIFTPNVEIGRGVNQPRYKIRGIGTDDFGVGADPAVGVYVDGVYIGRSGGSKTAFNDIQRVEILNGPQGTLFGRNAAAGAIQYITNKPVEGYEGWARATVGNYDRYQVEGVYNMPLSENVFWRTGVLWNQRDGFVDNKFTGNELGDEDNWSITTTLRWLPTDNLDIWWRMEYDEVDQYSRPSSSATFGLREGGADFENMESVADFDETRELFGTALHLTFHLNETTTFTSITSYREYETENPEDKDGQTDPFFDFDDLNEEDNDQWSQEFRFDGTLGENLTWLVGGIYSEETAKQRSGINLDTRAVDKLIVEAEIGVSYDSFAPGTGYELAWAFEFPGLPRIYSSGQEALAAGRYTENIDVEGQYESWGVFGDITYSILDNLDLTLGIRYTEDDKEFGRNVRYNDFGMFFAFDETRIDDNGNLVSFPDGRQGTYWQDESWDDTTGRAVLDYRVTDDVLLYASWAEGYKAGGFNSVGIRNDDPAFDPEEITTWELGIKSTWFDNTLRFNAAYFDYDYDNLQELSFVDAVCIPDSDFGNYQFLTSDIEGDGYEMSLNWLATPGLELWANAGNVESDVSDRTRCRNNNGVAEIVDQSGDTFADDFSYSVGATYTYVLGNASELALAVSWANIDGADDRTGCKYVEDLPDGTGAVYGLGENEDTGVLEITQPSAVGTLTEPPFDSCPDFDDREQLNARISWLSPRGDWQVAAWVTNATDWEPEGDPGGLGGDLRSGFSDGSPAWDRREEPRMYGLELTYTFK